MKTDSPTVKKSSLRLQFFLAAQYGWKVKTADVTSAFLQAGEMLDRDVYVKPPSDIHVEGWLWKLRVPVYGLGDAGKRWYVTISIWLVKQGCRKAKTDASLFFFVKNGVLHGVLTLHVDDMNFCGSRTFEEEVIKPMFAKFKFGKVLDGDFKTLGWNVEHVQGKIYVSQTDYIHSKLDFLKVQQEGLHQEKTPLTPENKSELRKLVGKLRWCTDQSRPDGAWEELWLSMSVSNPTVGTLNMANSLVNRIKGCEVKICYKKLRGQKWLISVFSDAAVGGLPDNASSAMGVVIFISNGYVPKHRNDCCVISWKSAKIRRVVSASYDAEVLALSEGLEEAIVLRDLLLEMTGMPTDMLEIEGFVDNHDTVEAIRACKNFHKGKRIGLEVAKIKEMLDRQEVKNVTWLPKELQIADCLTKRSSSKIPLLQALEQGKFMN